MNSFLILSLSIVLVNAGFFINRPNNRSTHSGPDLLQHLLVISSLTADAGVTSFTSNDSLVAIEAALKRVSVECPLAIDDGAVARKLSSFFTEHSASAYYEDYNFRYDSSFRVLAKAHVDVRRTAADNLLDVNVLFQCAAVEFKEAKDMTDSELQWLETFLNFHAGRKARTALLQASTPTLQQQLSEPAMTLIASGEWMNLESALARDSVLDSTTSTKAEPAAFVHVWTKVGAWQQQWQAFNHDTDGCFNLRSRRNNLCLDLAHYCGKNCPSPHNGEGNHTRLGAPFVTWHCHDKANQRFCAVPHDDGSVSLVVKLNWFTVDLENRNTADGTPFVAWPADGEPKQRFFVSRAQQCKCESH